MKTHKYTGKYKYVFKEAEKLTPGHPPGLGPKTNTRFFLPGAVSCSSAMCGPKSMNRDAWNGERRSSTLGLPWGGAA